MVTGRVTGVAGRGRRRPKPSRSIRVVLDEAHSLEPFKNRVIDAILDARAKQLDKEIMELLK